MDTLGTKIIVLISEVSLFQAENNMYLYKVGTQSSVLSKQGVLISEVSFKRGSTVFSNNRTVHSSARENGIWINVTVELRLQLYRRNVYQEA